MFFTVLSAVSVRSGGESVSGTADVGRGQVGDGESERFFDRSVYVCDDAVREHEEHTAGAGGYVHMFTVDDAFDFGGFGLLIFGQRFAVGEEFREFDRDRDGGVAVREHRFEL